MPCRHPLIAESRKTKRLTRLLQSTQLQSQVNTLAAKINYYENPNSPPSANSLAWIQERRQKRKDDQIEPKKPGGRKGHVGVSRRHSPSNTIHHNFQEIPKCDCGHAMAISENQTRDILDVQIMTTETRHRTQTVQCVYCNRTRHAPNDLPANGSYGKKIVLRYAVMFRKISGQIRGSESMRRMFNLMTCILTWRAHGKSIVDEVMARI